MAAVLAEEHDEVTFVGTPTGVEARLAREAGLPYVGVDAAGFDRSRPWTLVTASVRVAISALRVWALLGRLRPDVVAGFGGFVSIPVGLAAVLRRVPLVLHEQNSVPGLANRHLSRWATAVAVTYEETSSTLAHPERVRVTGNPVRASVLAAQRVAGRSRFGIEDGDVLLLVFGGSRGARHINSAMSSLCGRILDLPSVTVLHIAGRDEADSVRAQVAESGCQGRERWRVIDYLDEMGDAIAAADLVVCRAGATSIAELTARGAAAVLVPFPYATDDHQSKNARTLVEAGAAVLIADAELDDSRFGDELVSLLGDAGRRASMAAASKRLGRPDAGPAVAAMIRDAARSDAPVGR